MTLTLFRFDLVDNLFRFRRLHLNGYFPTVVTLAVVVRPFTLVTYYAWQCSFGGVLLFMKYLFFAFLANR